MNFVIGESEPPAAASPSGVLVVMRHSVRLDEDPAAEWEDKMRRPYDPPITDFVLPAQQARALKASGLHRFDRLVCSPFLRCLQTAAVVLKTLHGSPEPPSVMAAAGGARAAGSAELEAAESAAAAATPPPPLRPPPHWLFALYP